MSFAFVFYFLVLFFCFLSYFPDTSFEEFRTSLLPPLMMFIEMTGLPSCVFMCTVLSAKNISSNPLSSSLGNLSRHQCLIWASINSFYSSCPLCMSYPRLDTLSSPERNTALVSWSLPVSTRRESSAITSSYVVTGETKEWGFNSTMSYSRRKHTDQSSHVTECQNGNDWWIFGI